MVGVAAASANPAGGNRESFRCGLGIDPPTAATDRQFARKGRAIDTMAGPKSSQSA
jgi:hypothetical protein